MSPKFILCSVCFTLFISSCDKPVTEEGSKMDFLTASAWVIQKGEERDNNDPWIDVFPFQAACIKDDKWIFKSNFSLEYNDAANPCSPNIPNQVLDEVTWSFADNESKLIIDGITYLIEQLDANSLIIFTSTTTGGGVSEARITFGH